MMMMMVVCVCVCETTVKNGDIILWTLFMDPRDNDKDGK